MEVCPNCGDLVATLREISGWCDDCTKEHGCARCGKEFADSDKRSTCSTCRSLMWLEQNIDAIEQFERKGLTIREAIKAVRKANKRECANCGTTIDKGIFCSSKPECRKAYNRFRWKKSKGIDHATAIREAVEYEDIFA